MRAVSDVDMVVTDPSTILKKSLPTPDACNACGDGSEAELFNQSKWDYTRGYFTDLLGLVDTRKHYSSLLDLTTLRIPFQRGTFRHTAYSETSTLSSQAPSSSPESSASKYCTRTTITTQIFERYLGGTEHEESTPSGWICVSCLEEIIKSKLPWWISDWQKDPGQPKENCPYGVNCVN